MLRRHALAGSAREGWWRLPAWRVGRAGGAPGVLGRETRSRHPRGAVQGSRGSRRGRQAGGRARGAARPEVCGRSRGSAGRWDALRTHVAPGGGKPRRVGAGTPRLGRRSRSGGSGGLQTGSLGGHLRGIDWGLSLSKAIWERAFVRLRGRGDLTPPAPLPFEGRGGAGSASAGSAGQPRPLMGEGALGEWVTPRRLTR